MARRHGAERVRDMMLSLAVVGGAVLAVFLIYPRDDGGPLVREVDYADTVERLARNTTMPVYAPEGLPPNWQANFVRIDTDPATLHLGLVVDEKRFARVDQAAAPTDEFYEEVGVGSRVDGRVVVGGLEYEIRRGGDDSDDSVALVRPLPDGAVLTVSDGGSPAGGTLDDLTTVAAALQEQPG